MRKNRNSDNACLWKGKNSFQTQKASKRAFDKYSINAGKKQSAVLAFLQNAAKHPETAFRAEFYQNRDTLTQQLTFASPVRYKGNWVELRCLLYTAMAVEHTAEE